MFRKSAVLAVAAAAASATLVATPAYADEPQPDPNNPDVVIGYGNEDEEFPPEGRGR
jgi:hypothetical protein